LLYNRFTLAFTGEWAHLEPEFLAHHHQEVLIRTRVATLVATFFYGIFGILDAVVIPEMAHIFWIIRYGVVIPVALGVLALTFTRYYRALSQQALFFMLLVGGLGIELMILLADPPAKYSYYAGIILVIIVLHTAIGLRFPWALACSVTIVAVYEIIAVWLIDFPFHYLVSSNFFFISSVLLSMLAGYSMERNSRHRFFANHLLTLEKQKVQAANKKLDQRVKERTRALSETNQRLKVEMNQRLVAQEKRLELETTLNQRHKAEALGTLAGGIAHDFNNILAAILGYTEILQQDLPPEDANLAHVSEILKAAQRARDLTGQILTFSRQTEQAYKAFAIAPVIKEAIGLIRASVPPAITMETHISSNGWVLADPTQIHRVVINLCTNSIQAMADTPGHLTVTLEDIDLAAPFRAGEATLDPGPFVKLRVKDTGAGMTQETTRKIFDPFFSTKGVKGTGMGLSVVHGVIKNCQGGIQVDSALGKGTCFSIFLPAVAAEEPVHGEDDPADIPKGNGEHILFVDDETTLVTMMKTALPPLGYRITAVTSPREALGVLNRRQHDIDLVITDFSMPGMNGLALAQQVKKQLPHLPVILSTGYGEAITQEGLDRSGISGFIMKPLTRTALGKKIHQVLSQNTEKSQVPSGAGQQL